MHYAWIETLCVSPRTRVTTMVITEANDTDIPLALLLEADPSEDNIRTYMDGAWRYIVTDGDSIIAACIVKPIAERCAEIFNIAVMPERQQGGVGASLLAHVMHDMKAKNIARLELGTGAFGYQLTFYQRMGFRVDAVEKDYFLQHYAQPVMESGLQHKDRLRLSAAIQ